MKTLLETSAEVDKEHALEEGPGNNGFRKVVARDVVEPVALLPFCSHRNQA